MSAIIKSDNLVGLGAIRSLSAPVPPPAVSQDEEDRARLEREIATLKQDLARRDDALQELQLDVDRALVRGREEGRKLGLADAEDREADRLLVLEKALAAAHGEMRVGLGALERLAALLARECLDTILGDGSDKAGAVAQIIAAQLAKIDRAMVLSVEVSAEDFPDEARLEAMAEKIGRPAMNLVTIAELPSGGCVLTLRLGRMDVSLSQQWSALRDVLNDAARFDEVAA